MVVDHVNKFLFDEKLPGAFELGRLAMPLFVFVLAYNLARPVALTNGAFGRTLKRLCIAGAVTTPVFVSLVGWWPLNIMFTLALCTAVLWLIEADARGSKVAAAVLFVVGGAFVEFWWPAVALCDAAWWFCRRPSGARGVALLLACASLAVVNGMSNAVVNGVAVLAFHPNHWALASLPVMAALTRVNVRIPRVRHFFYAFYPAHLVLLWIATRHF
ncbi:MAG: conjugal transfer protein TraX [Ramlibacter sp.]|nr:conjugal transfer protein TraX [Ramlibacter sp.]